MTESLYTRSSFDDSNFDNPGHASFGASDTKDANIMILGKRVTKKNLQIGGGVFVAFLVLIISISATGGDDPTPAPAPAPAPAPKTGSGLGKPTSGSLTNNPTYFSAGGTNSPTSYQTLTNNPTNGVDGGGSTRSPTSGGQVCQSNSDCIGTGVPTKPRCNTMANPQVCVGCNSDRSCSGEGNAMVCTPSGACSKPPTRSPTRQPTPGATFKPTDTSKAPTPVPTDLGSTTKPTPPPTPQPTTPQPTGRPTTSAPTPPGATPRPTYAPTTGTPSSSPTPQPTSTPTPMPTFYRCDELSIGRTMLSNLLPVVRAVSNVKGMIGGLSYTTYRVYVSTVNKPKSAKMNSWQVTAMYGMKGSPLYVPAAFQNDVPYGTDIGGLPSTLTTYNQSCSGSGNGCHSNYLAARDSWLTIGEDDGTPRGLSTNIDHAGSGTVFKLWTAQNALLVDPNEVDDDQGNSIIFGLYYLDPSNAPTRTVSTNPTNAEVLLAQLTLRSDAKNQTMIANVQGRAWYGTSGSQAALWEERELKWDVTNTNGTRKTRITCPPTIAPTSAPSPAPTSAPTSLHSKAPTTPAPTRHHDVDCTQDIRVGAVLSDVTGKCELTGNCYFNGSDHTKCMQTPAQGQKPDLSRYACSLTLPKEAMDVYTIYGKPGKPMRLPPAFQVSKNQGGVDMGKPIKVLERIYPMLAWDSWVYMGCTAVPCKAGQAIQELNVDFSSWNMSHGLNISDGAVFFMDPTKAYKPKGTAARKVLMMQITVNTSLYPNIMSNDVSYNMQGTLTKAANETKAQKAKTIITNGGVESKTASGDTWEEVDFTYGSKRHLPCNNSNTAAGRNASTSTSGR